MVTEAVHACTLSFYIECRGYKERKDESFKDLNFWHRSFLTTIMVDHYPLLEFACSKIIIANIFISYYYSSFMLCSFGISTEASAPAVLSLNKYQELIIETMYTILATHSQSVLSKFLMFPHFNSLFQFIIWL